MKKIVCLFTMTLVLFIFSGSKTIFANSTYLVNENNIEISYEEYNHLKIFGFTDDEIKVIDRATFDDFISKEIKFSYKEETYIETIYTIENDKVINEVDNIITEEEMTKKVKEYKDKELKDKVKKMKDSQVIEVSPRYIPDPCDDGLCSGGGDLEDTKTAEFDYKYFTIHGVYYNDRGDLGEFYVKTSLVWQIPPTQRWRDIIAVTYPNSKLVAKKTIVNGQSYPDINADFKYKKEYTSNFEPGYTKIIHDTVTPDMENTRYREDIDKGYIATDFQLPKDSEYWDPYYEFQYKYTDFSMNLEVTFEDLEDFHAAVFSGSYSHQYAAGTLDWGTLNVSPVPPYISYSWSGGNNDPQYDSGIGGSIRFENLN